MGLKNLRSVSNKEDDFDEIVYDLITPLKKRFRLY